MLPKTLRFVGADGAERGGDLLDGREELWAEGQRHAEAIKGEAHGLVRAVFGDDEGGPRERGQVRVALGEVCEDGERGGRVARDAESFWERGVSLGKCVRSAFVVERGFVDEHVAAGARGLDDGAARPRVPGQDVRGRVRLE